MKLTIIGAGNMGGASARGFAAARVFDKITLTAAHRITLDAFEGLCGVETSLDNCKAVEGADIVCIVVKPWLVESVACQIKPVLKPSQTVVCMAAGVPSGKLQEWLGKDCPIVLVIPNTAIEYGQSMTFVANVSAPADSLAAVAAAFSKVGQCIETDEKHLSAGIALASCGIAYAMRYIRASSQGGVELGIKPADAVKVVCQTVKGAAAILEESGANPEAAIDKVTTPGGWTIKGLNAMEQAGFTGAVVQGLKASVK